MADDFGIETINMAELKDYILDVPEKSFDAAKMVFKKAVLAADTEVKGRFGSKIQSRTGSLRRSLATSVSGHEISNLQASFYAAAYAGGLPLLYTLAQEKGAKIRAIDKYKKVPGGPYLNIPVLDNLTAAGVMRMSAREVFKAGGYIAKRRHKFGTKKWGVFLKGKLMFVLRKEVTLKPRLGMVDAGEKQIPTILSSLLKLIGAW